MSYGDFSLRAVVSRFDLELSDRADLFRDVPERPPSDLLRETLADNVSLAMAVHTEKARSEFIVAPVLAEIRRCFRNRVSLFSGIELNVDPDNGLNGVCDFILSRSPVQHYLQRPVAIIVEAKGDCIPDGLGQCAAGMLAAFIFNEREGRPVSEIHGAVTTGTLWQFLQLREKVLSIDAAEYHIDRVGKILGVLASMLSDEGEHEKLVA